MKISKRVGKMALECVSKDWMTIYDPRLYRLWRVSCELGWENSANEDAGFDYYHTRAANAHFDTLMCLIASIAGVKPEDSK